MGVSSSWDSRFCAPLIKEKQQNFEITDQKQTLFERNNRPILTHLNNRPEKTNIRQIPDLITQIIQQYQTGPCLRGIT